MKICRSFIRPDNQELCTCVALQPLILCKGTFPLKCEELKPLKVITEAWWTKSPSCSLPGGFLHSSPKNWHLQRCCCHLKAVLWRFLEFRHRMGYTYRAGKVQVQQKSSCFRELPSQCTCWLQGWEVTGSQVRAPKSRDEHPEWGHPRQAASATCLGSNDPQDLGGVRRGTQEEPPKDCKGTKEPAWAQHCQTRADHFSEAENPPGGDGQTLPSYRTFQNVILEWAGLNTFKPQQLRSLYMLETKSDPRQAPGARGIVGMTTETQTLCEPCVLLQLKTLLVFTRVPRKAALGRSWEVFIGTCTFQSSSARIRSLLEASR